MEKYDRIIRFDQLSTNGVVYEKVESFRESIFVDVYEKANTLVDGIIGGSEKWTYARKRGESLVNAELSNVISFIGRRGTGKTSAMLSFYNALLEKESYEKMREIFPSRIPESHKNDYYYSRKCRTKINFCGLECIDASSLEDSEDVFILVLANMLDRIMGISRNNSLEFREYENRSLLQKFEKIYEDFLTLKRTSELNKEGYSNFEKLKSIASSRKIKEQFADLVADYLRIVNESSSLCMEDESGRYLVIAIDDLDMRRHLSDGNKGCEQKRGSYEIMRSIHQYLSVPGVIILTAYNHEHLYEQCKMHFSNSRNSSDLTSQFMEKVFAVNARLYMPSWRKRDFASENQMKIDIRDNDKDVLKLFQERDQGRLTTKQFILALLGEKADIYFDCKGLKRHFFEPDTLRSLYSMTEYLLGLKDYGSILDKSMDLEAYELVIKKLKEDFFFRYVEEKLENTKERKLFDQWLEQKIERRSEAIVSLVCQHTHKLGKRIKLEYEEIVLKAERAGKSVEIISPGADRILNNSKVEYSYAELVHSIYHMTRDTECHYSKEMVACILESFTLYLTGIYRRYIYYKRQLSKEEYFRLFREKNKKDIQFTKEENELYKEIQENSKIFKSIIGNAVCGKWTEYYFPEVRINLTRSRAERLYDIPPQSGNYIIGYVDNSNLECEFELECMKKKDFEKGKEKLTDNAAYSIKSFLFLVMMQTNVLSWSQNKLVCEFQSAEVPWENDALVFRLAGDGKVLQNLKNDFDLTGCFKYTLFYTDFLNKMEKLISNALQNVEIEEIERLDWTREDVISEYEKIIESVFKELWSDYYFWDRDYGNMMIPIYNLDLSYNIIKRVFQDCKKSNIDPIYIDDVDNSTAFIQEYANMLNRFRVHFRQVDEYYCLDGSRKGFAEVFTNCPYYKMVDEVVKNPERNPEFNRTVSLAIKNIALGMEIREDELTSPGE